MTSVSKYLYDCLENQKDSKLGIVIQSIIIFMIILNIVGISLNTVAELHNTYGNWFEYIESSTVAFFTFELFLRYIVIGNNFAYAGFKGRIKFTFTLFTLIDILSILPFFLTFLGFNSSFFRILRLFRVFKLFRTTKTSSFGRAIHKVFVTERENLIMTFSSIGIILVIFTFLVYFVENDVQPHIFSSIPKTLWWAVLTLSTLGYGEMYPITVIGRIITTIITMIGIAFYAIPGGLFTAALIEEINIEKKKKNKYI